MILYMYIAPGQGQTIPWGQNFLYKYKPFVTLVICCKFLPLIDFLTVFPIQKHKRPNVSPHVYNPGQGQTTLCGQNHDVNRKALSLCPFVARLKKISLKSDFIQNLS